MEGVDPRRLEVRLLKPLDLAVSKLSRLNPLDQDDIRALASPNIAFTPSIRIFGAKGLVM